ncbi:MAG TPA: hypothetical protein VLQ68_11025 [Rhizobiaceae bacterium]|nr:hypothetical protein [Rhizobiaceae bacterium]
MRNELIFVAVGAAILNGIFSADQFVVSAFSPFWYPWLFPRSPELIQFLSSLILSTLTVMVAGVPAAIYERVKGLSDTNSVSAAIWAVASFVLLFPSLPVIFRALAG